MRRIKIHPSMAVLVPFYIFLGRGKEFFLILSIVLMHEVFHIITGRIFGLRFKEIMLTPIGIRAVIPNIGSIGMGKRIIVYLSGPVSNFILGLILIFIIPKSEILSFAANASFCIGIFNLLPVLPLDAGNIFFQVLSAKHGVLNAADIMKKAGTAISVLMIVAGIFQLILYGFNVSLLLIGIFIYKNNENEHFNRKTDFFKYICSMEKSSAMPVKSLIAWDNTAFLEIIKRFNYDNYYLVYVNGRFVEQTEIFDLMLKYGSDCKICVSKELSFP